MSVPDSFHIQQPLHNLSTWVVLWWEIERCCSRTPEASKGDFKSLITVWWISTERRSSRCATDMQAPRELAVMVVGHTTWVITACCHSTAAWLGLFQRVWWLISAELWGICRNLAKRRWLLPPCSGPASRRRHLWGEQSLPVPRNAASAARRGGHTTLHFRRNFPKWLPLAIL